MVSFDAFWLGGTLCDLLTHLLDFKITRGNVQVNVRKDHRMRLIVLPTRTTPPQLILMDQKGVFRPWRRHIVSLHAQLVMPPPLIGGGIKRSYCLTSDVCLVCLSRTSGLSREQRGLGRQKSVGYRGSPRHT